MAITPGEAERFTASELARLSSIEDRIDAILAARYVQGRTVSIGRDELDIVKRFRNEIMRRYQAAEWEVRFIGPIGSDRYRQVEFMPARYT